LSKIRCDLTSAVREVDWRVEYVLRHAWLLIVRFFDKEGVVLDTFGQRLGRGYGERRR
jgi:hypothetical protein